MKKLKKTIVGVSIATGLVGLYCQTDPTLIEHTAEIMGFSFLGLLIIWLRPESKRPQLP